MQDKNFMKFIKIHQIKFGFRNNILNAKEMLKWPLLLCLSLLCHVLLYNQVNKQDLYQLSEGKRVLNHVGHKYYTLHLMNSQMIVYNNGYKNGEWHHV